MIRGNRVRLSDKNVPECAFTSFHGGACSTAHLERRRSWFGVCVRIQGPYHSNGANSIEISHSSWHLPGKMKHEQWALFKFPKDFTIRNSSLLKDGKLLLIPLWIENLLYFYNISTNHQNDSQRSSAHRSSSSRHTVSVFSLFATFIYVHRCIHWRK